MLAIPEVSWSEADVDGLEEDLDVTFDGNLDGVSHLAYVDMGEGRHAIRFRDNLADIQFYGFVYVYRHATEDSMVVRYYKIRGEEIVYA